MEKIVTIKFMSPLGLGSVIKADFINKTVEVENFTDKIPLTAFGVNKNPTWENFERFLEDRVLPRTRDKIKICLDDIGVPYWDPILIIKKTQGRMSFDQCWLDVEGW